jgi:hypothetical protein
VVAPATIYVKTNGTPSFPYASWDTAATNIQTAINSAIDNVTIMVTNGTYYLPAALTFTKAVTLRSVNGPSQTTLDGRSADRCIYVNNADAVIDGFTITHGKISDFGGAIHLYQKGVVKNSVIRESLANAHYAGAAYLNQGGTLQNCLICCNTGMYAGAIYFNIAGTMDGCTVVSNTSTAAGYPGAFFIAVNDTMIRNSIVYNNTALGGGAYTNWRADSSATWSYSCTFPNPGGAGVITNNPKFVNFDAGDYRLQFGSPCKNTGTNQTWMTGTLDVAGNPRISGKIVDMGAYERPVTPSGTMLLVR